MIYCDNAATSFPKPEAVGSAMVQHLATEAVNPGRSGFDLAIHAGSKIDTLRSSLNKFFHNPDPDFNRTIFTPNATAALNIAIQGLCKPGDHVLTDTMAHNSVLRPLHMLRDKGLISFDLIPCNPLGLISPLDVAASITPRTRLVVLNQASNVNGIIQPAAAIGAICRERDVLFLLDVAQTAGILPVDMTSANIDLVAFTGHKGMMGPTGTGGLILGPRAEPRGICWGGTGVRSQDLEQPQQLPFRLEAGTLNAVGLAGLTAGLQWVQDEGLEKIRAHEQDLAEAFCEGCREIPGLKIWGHPEDSAEAHMAVVSLTCADMDPAKVGTFLDVQYGIAVRTGLHCAPLAHQALGSGSTGTVRFSFGPFNQEQELHQLLQALHTICCQ